MPAIDSLSAFKNLIQFHRKDVPDREGMTRMVQIATGVSSELSEQGVYRSFLQEMKPSLKRFSRDDLTSLMSFIDLSGIRDDAIARDYKEILQDIRDTRKRAILIKTIALLHRSAFLKYEIEDLMNNEDELVRRNPWLWAEILAIVDWQKCVSFVDDILGKDNDFVSLYECLVTWEADSNISKPDLKAAIHRWMRRLSDKDQSLLTSWADERGLLESQLKTSLSEEARRCAATIENFIQRKIVQMSCPSLTL